MTEWFTVNDAHRDVLARAGLATFDDWMDVATDDERPAGRQETLTRFDLPGRDDFGVFLKRCRPAGPMPRFFLRHSRQRREAESAWTLQTLDVPTVEVVAAGERRRFGCVSAAFVATCEIRGAGPVSERATTSRRERNALIDALARVVRRMHDGGFVDHDLYLRNVLVRRTPEGAHEVFIIDSPRGRLRRFGQRRGTVRDLACLDRGARTRASRSDRVRFMKTYLGRERLDDADVRLMREIDVRLPRPLRENAT